MRLSPEMELALKALGELGQLTTHHTPMWGGTTLYEKKYATFKMRTLIALEKRKLVRRSSEKVEIRDTGRPGTKPFPLTITVWRLTNG